jgi:hypothetical protein
MVRQQPRLKRAARLGFLCRCGRAFTRHCTLIEAHAPMVAGFLTSSTDMKGRNGARRRRRKLNVPPCLDRLTHAQKCKERI